MTTVSASGTALMSVTATATASTRSQLYINHMLAAATFARELGAVQAQHDGGPIGDFVETILMKANAAAIMSVAAAEAYLNGILEDGLKLFPDDMLLIFNKNAESIERMEARDKADWILLLRKTSQLERGSHISQQFAALCKLRNALIHYRPEWSHEDKTHARLSAFLGSARIAPNPWMSSDVLWFPRKWAGHSGASWAVHTSLAFIRHVATHASLPEPFGPAYNARLATNCR